MIGEKEIAARWPEESGRAAFFLYGEDYRTSTVLTFFPASASSKALLVSETG